MKRIEFISPVEAIRGNMSGNQKLLYAENNNPAWDAPKEVRNYARNYTPRFIGAKIAATGHKYFSVRTKSATRLTSRSLKAMALTGGAGAIFASMLRRKDLTPYTGMMQLYTYNVEQRGYKGTFRKFVMDFLRRGLEAKVENFTANVASISVSFKNPWFDGSMTDGATVKQEVLVKFWLQLAPNGIKFDIEGVTYIAKKGITWQSLIDSDMNINRLKVSPVTDHDTAIASAGSTAASGSELGYDYNGIFNNVTLNEVVATTVTDPEIELYWKEY